MADIHLNYNYRIRDSSDEPTAVIPQYTIFEGALPSDARLGDLAFNRGTGRLWQWDGSQWFEVPLTRSGDTGLTNATFITLFNIAIPNNSHANGRVFATVQTVDSTNNQYEAWAGQTTYSAINKGGTISSNIGAFATTSATATTGIGVTVVTNTSAGTDSVNIRIRATSGLAAVDSLNCKWEVQDLARRSLT